MSPLAVSLSSDLTLPRRSTSPDPRDPIASTAPSPMTSSTYLTGMPRCLDRCSACCSSGMKSQLPLRLWWARMTTLALFPTSSLMVGTTLLILASLTICRVFLSRGQLMSTLRRTVLSLKLKSSRVLKSLAIGPPHSLLGIPRASFVFLTDAAGSCSILHMDLMQSMFSGITSDSWWTAW